VCLWVTTRSVETAGITEEVNCTESAGIADQVECVETGGHVRAQS